MTNLNTKITLFNSICLASRVGIVLLLYFFPYQEMSILPLLIGFGFLYQKLKNDKKGFFGSSVYWPRLIHSFTYITAGILLLIEETRKYAFWVLAADIILGFFVFWSYYLKNIFINTNCYKYFYYF